MKWRRASRVEATDRRADLRLLATLNVLSQSLRRGVGDDAALRIAELTLQLLDARAVAVTIDDRIAARVGDPLDWATEIADRSRAVLERRRVGAATIYQAEIDGRTTEVAVAVLTSGDVPVGTIHVVPAGAARLSLSDLDELTALLSSQLELAELEQSRAAAAEAELRALRAQISPHFLHNSLTAIAGLVMSEPARARALIAKFSEFLRSSFRTQTDLTTVAEELRLVETYLELERMRFGDRFGVSLNIAPEVLVVRLPFLTVQPIVENAIRHGLEARPGPGHLHIVAEDLGPEVAISVEDDGVGIDADLLERALGGTDETSHVGILAVDTRLRSVFGPDYGLTIETGPGAGTKTIIRLPK